MSLRRARVRPIEKEGGRIVGFRGRGEQANSPMPAREVLTCALFNSARFNPVGDGIAMGNMPRIWI
jgi:hypothetical protein